MELVSLLLSLLLVPQFLAAHLASFQRSVRVKVAHSHVCPIACDTGYHVFKPSLSELGKFSHLVVYGSGALICCKQTSSCQEKCHSEMRMPYTVRREHVSEELDIS